MTASPRSGGERPTPTILGVGAAVPSQLITNADLVARLDTSDEWIVRRTGIRERRHLRETETLAEIAAAACTDAIIDAGCSAAGVDHLIVATITPDRLTPGLAPAVAARIGAPSAGVLDINAACCGFLYGLDQAAALIE
ncbi:MAG: ketoacyl-ACP synthase III, partial [Solirubrobacteraceae bacterium]